MSFTNPLIADTLLSPFERLGRVVMDLGFGGFLEKFENHFGSGLTKALLILIGLAVATICASVIWTYLLLPFARVLPDPRARNASEAVKLVFIVTFFLMITNQLLSLADNYLKRRIRAQMRRKVEEAERIANAAEEKLKEARELLAETEERQKKSGDILAAADLAMDRVLDYALKNKMLSQAEVDELRALIAD